MNAKIHVVNSGPDVVVLHVEGRNGKAIRSSRELLPGDSAEVVVPAGEYVVLTPRGHEQ